MNQQATAGKILTLYPTLSEEQQRFVNSVIVALRTLEEPKKALLIRFLRWSIVQDSDLRNAGLELVALACNENERAWEIMEASLEDEEEA